MPEREPPAPRAFSEDHWALNTTIRCQHRCVYCFEGDRAGHRNVPFEEAKCLVDRAAGEVPAVIFMGAEPTLNPDLPALVRYASSLGLRPSISTNAMRLANRDYLRELSEAGLETIELSFPYPDANVYGALTRAHPRGFNRLLNALENIEELNRSVPGAHSVNANVVVSRFNVARLEEVVEHLVKRFTTTRYMITLKRVEHAAVLPDDRFVSEVHVPCRELRRRLPAVVNSAPGSPEIRFRGFPSCALPGLEERDYDLFYWLTRVDVRQNFVDQSEVHAMYPDRVLRSKHRYQWICDACAASQICIQRGLFTSCGDSDEDVPVGHTEPLRESLVAWVKGFPRGEETLRANPDAVQPAHSWLLQELDRATGPGRRIPGTQATWEPRETGILTVREDGRTIRVSVTPIAARSTARGEAGDWTVDPLGDGGAGTVVRALRHLVRSLPGMPEQALTDGALALLSGPLRNGDTGGATGPAAPWPDGPALRAWETFLRARVLPRVSPAGQTGSSPAAHPAIVEAHKIVLSRGGGEAPVAIGVQPAGGSGGAGFLCGPYRLQVPEAVAGDASLAQAVRGIARSCLEVSPDFWPPACAASPSDFLADAWEAFGALLLPRSGVHGCLCRGEFDSGEVKLGFLAGDGTRFEIVLLQAGVARHPVASRVTIALQYHVTVVAAHHPLLRRVVRQYASRLAGWRA